MLNKMNFFTGLVFLYSLLVCFTCKQANPSKCGNFYTTSHIAQIKTIANPINTATKNIKIENGSKIYSANKYTLK
jgi:hypothetical protein